MLGSFNSSCYAYICFSKITIIDWDNGLSPGRCQAFIWNSAEISLIGPLGTNFSEILIVIFYIFIKDDLFESVWKMAAVLSRSQCIKDDYYKNLQLPQQLFDTLTK